LKRSGELQRSDRLDKTISAVLAVMYLKKLDLLCFRLRDANKDTPSG